MINTNKRATESFLVSLAAQNTIKDSGTSATLVNSATGNVNLNNGQLGIVSMSSFGSVAPWGFTDATPSLAEAPVIAIVQGTSASASVSSATATYPLWVRPFEISNPINGRNKSVVVTKQPFRLASHNVWVVGAPTGGADEINVLDETLYELVIGYRGRRVEEFYSQENAANLPITFTTPDFTTLATAEPIDWIVSKAVYEINRNSFLFNIGARYQGNDPVVAFAVGTTAGSGTLISGLTAGSTVNVFVYDGITRTLTLTAEMVASIQAAATASGHTYIYNTDMANAGTSTGGTAEGIMIMGLDSKTAYVDYVPQLKTRLIVSIPSGFDYTTVYNSEEVKTDEGQGYSRQLDLLYKATQGQRKYAQRHVLDPVVNFASPILDGEQYTVYNILHGNSEQVDTFNMVYSPYREIICIPRYSSGTTPNAALTELETALDSWLVSTGNTAVKTID